MIMGSHNSLTGYPLADRQKYIGFLINSMCKCQNKRLYAQYNCGVRLFDLQTSGTSLLCSHGIAWYDKEVDEVLLELNSIAKLEGESIYIMLGLDNHWYQPKEDKRLGETVFYNLINGFHEEYPNLKLVRAYTEKPWRIIYEDKDLANNIFEKYWSLSWAKSMMKRWWQFYYYLPIPRLWKRICGKQWNKEAEESGKKFYVTDFV